MVLRGRDFFNAERDDGVVARETCSRRNLRLEITFTENVDLVRAIFAEKIHAVESIPEQLTADETLDSRGHHRVYCAVRAHKQLLYRWQRSRAAAAIAAARFVFLREINPRG